MMGCFMAMMKILIKKLVKFTVHRTNQMVLMLVMMLIAWAVVVMEKESSNEFVNGLT